MKIDDLKVCCVSISEFGYDYRGIFILSSGESEQKKSLKVDLADFESDPVLLATIKDHFEIEDSLEVLKSTVMKKVMTFAGLSSKDVHGENYNRDTID